MRGLQGAQLHHQEEPAQRPGSAGAEEVLPALRPAHLPPGDPLTGIDPAIAGRVYPPSPAYEVGREKIREYANAVGEANPVHHDPAAAREAGFRNVVAPPMFCVVYSAPAIAPGILDPEVGINFPAMVHGGQAFEWGEPVCAGDVITTAASCEEIYEKDGKGFYVFESISTNQDDQQVVRGTWTNIVRGV